MSKTYNKLSVKKTTTNFREAVEVVSVPLVPPTDDQILVKNIYAGVNATDINITAARYRPDIKVPFDVGLEGLGVIEAVGKNVTNFTVGQPVVVFGVSSPRSYAQYIYLRADEGQIKPIPSLKPEFIGLLVCGLTAVIGLDQLGHIKKGEKVLITASAGGTGHIAIQWAKQQGAYVIGLTSSPEKAKLLKELGTDRVINYKTEDLDEVLTKEFPQGIDVVWETIGGKVYETLFRHLALKGRLIVVGGISGYKSEGIPKTNISTTELLRGAKTISGFFLSVFKDLYDKYLKQLIEDLESNRLRVVLDFGQNTTEGEFKGIDAIVRGVEHLHLGRNTGKVVIKIQDP